MCVIFRFIACLVAGSQVCCNSLCNLFFNFILWVVFMRMLFILRAVGLMKELFSIADRMLFVKKEIRFMVFFCCQGVRCQGVMVISNENFSVILIFFCGWVCVVYGVRIGHFSVVGVMYGWLLYRCVCGVGRCELLVCSSFLCDWCVIGCVLSATI